MSVAADEGTRNTPGPKDPRHGPRFVSVEYFWKEMLGLTNKSWFYNHKNDPGMPRRVYFGGKPMLLYDECRAYIDHILAERVPRPANRAKKDPPRKPRRVGRPVGPVKRRA